MDKGLYNEQLENRVLHWKVMDSFNYKQKYNFTSTRKSCRPCKYIVCRITCGLSVALSSKDKMMFPGPARRATPFLSELLLGLEQSTRETHALKTASLSDGWVLSCLPQSLNENEEWRLRGFAERIFVFGLSVCMEKAATKLGCEVSGCLEEEPLSWTVFIKVDVLKLYEYLWYCCGYSQHLSGFKIQVQH